MYGVLWYMCCGVWCVVMYGVLWCMVCSGICVSVALRCMGKFFLFFLKHLVMDFSLT